MTTGTLTDRTVLAQAADLITRRGKAVGAYEDDRCRVCVLGAISYVICGDPLQAAVACLGELDDDPAESLYAEALARLADHLTESDDPVWLACGHYPTWARARRIATWSDHSQPGHAVNALRAAAGGETP